MFTKCNDQSSKCETISTYNIQMPVAESHDRENILIPILL
jgi:hypothetical protein